MIALAVVLLIAELWVIVVVASYIGVLETILLLIAVSIAGIWLVKRAGLAALGRLRATLDQGRVPHREVVDAFLLLAAGLLLVPPGFITDAIGLLLLLPPVRFAVRAWLLRSFGRRTSMVVRVVDGVGRRVDFRDVPSRDAVRPDDGRGPATARRPPELEP